MFKSLSSLLTLLFILSFGASTQAFNIGGAVNRAAQGAAKGAARGAVASEYNKKLAKHKCRCNDTQTQVEGCNIDAIVSELNAFRNAAEGSGFARDVDINVDSQGKDSNSARQCANLVRDKVRAQVGWWDYHVRYNKGDKERVLLQVSVR